MDFFGRLPDRDRDRLLNVASTLRLARGDYLLRRGDRGGDIFRVVEGELEVVDTRVQPAVVLDVIGRGAMVGEMAFLDEQARLADVRAVDLAVVQRWDRATLLRLLDRDAALAASFYRALASMAVERARAVTQNAITGGLGKVGGPALNAAAADEGRRVADELRARLDEAEAQLRREPQAGRRDAVAALHTFDARFSALLARMGAEDADAAGEAASHELRPYLVRARLGELLLNRSEGQAGGVEGLDHVDAGRPAGQGPLGEVIDGWLLSLPTPRGIRERRGLAASLVPELAAPNQGLKALLLGASGGRVVADALPSLDRLGGEVVCLDHTREGLATVSQALQDRVSRVRLRLAQDDIAAIALGSARMSFPGRTLIVIDGLLEYLPERGAVGLLRWARQQLSPGGALLLTAVAPGADDGILRHLLRWPMLRRTRPSLGELVGASGFGGVRTYEASSTGLVAVATQR